MLATGLKQIENARQKLFRGSVKGLEWQRLKNKEMSYALNVTGIIEKNIEDDEEGSGTLEKGFDNPNAGQFIGNGVGYKGQIGGSFVPEHAISTSAFGGAGNRTGMGNMKSNNLTNDEASLNLEKVKIPNVYLEELEPLSLLNESQKRYTNAGFYNGFSITCDVISKKTEKNRRRAEIAEIMKKMRELKA